jgi:hypothetical protein
MDSKKLSKFLSKVISSAYRDGVDRVTDSQGNLPSEENNFLLSEDGKQFSGLFFNLKNKVKYKFTLTDNEGKWSLKY